MNDCSNLEIQEEAHMIRGGLIMTTSPCLSGRLCQGASKEVLGAVMSRYRATLKVMTMKFKKKLKESSQVQRQDNSIHWNIERYLKDGLLCDKSVALSSCHAWNAFCSVVPPNISAFLTTTKHPGTERDEWPWTLGTERDEWPWTLVKTDDDYRLWMANVAGSLMKAHTVDTFKACIENCKRQLPADTMNPDVAAVEVTLSRALERMKHRPHNEIVETTDLLLLARHRYANFSLEALLPEPTVGAHHINLHALKEKRRKAQAEVNDLIIKSEGLQARVDVLQAKTKMSLEFVRSHGGVSILHSKHKIYLWTLERFLKDGLLSNEDSALKSCHAWKAFCSVVPPNISAFLTTTKHPGTERDEWPWTLGTERDEWPWTLVKTDDDYRLWMANVAGSLMKAHTVDTLLANIENCKRQLPADTINSDVTAVEVTLSRALQRMQPQPDKQFISQAGLRYVKFSLNQQ